MFLSSTPSNMFLESSFKSAKQRHFHRLFCSLNDWGLAAEFHYSCKVFRSSSVISPLISLQPVLIHCFSIHILCLGLHLVFLGWMEKALEITIQLSSLSSFFSLCYPFWGIRALIVQALQTSFCIFLRLSPDWPQASFIILKKKNPVLMFSMRS